MKRTDLIALAERVDRGAASWTEAQELAAIAIQIAQAQPVGWIVPGSISWREHQSETVQKLTRSEQWGHGFTQPLYTLPLED